MRTRDRGLTRSSTIRASTRSCWACWCAGDRQVVVRPPRGEDLGAARDGGRCRLDDLEDRSDQALEAPFCCLDAPAARLCAFRSVHAPGRRLERQAVVARRLGRRGDRPTAARSNSVRSIRPVRWAISINGGCTGRRRAFTAEGVNGQFVYVNPAKKLVVVMTSVWPNSGMIGWQRRASPCSMRSAPHPELGDWTPNSNPDLRRSSAMPLRRAELLRRFRFRTGPNRLVLGASRITSSPP